MDLLLRGGTVVDGTGAPARTADVAIAGGQITAIGMLDGGGAEVIDADGLWVTPGFVDMHTHYDAQLHWDPTASPASWHGVTTVMCGNCGFTIAPSKPDDVPWLLLMLSRVEGMSAEALQAAVDFEGGGVGDLLAGLEGRVGVNVGVNVGHSAVRRYVMGDDASERAATDDEVAAMRDLVRQALEEGAVGFTSSQLDIHVAHDGREVPSNHATPDEVVSLASVLGEVGRGCIEFIPRSFLHGYDDADRELIRRMAEASGRAVHLNLLTRMPHAPDGWSRSLEFAQEAAADGLHVHPTFATNRQGAHFSLDSTFLFDELASFRETLTLPEPERSERLRDPALRDRMRAEIAEPGERAFMFVWEVVNVEAVEHPANEKLVGRSVTDVAAETAVDPLDAFLDLSLEEGLRTQFVLEAPPDTRTAAVTEQLIQSPEIMPGSSDGGAHLLSFCGADYSTRLLTEWVPNTLSIEQAVQRITQVPAQAYGLDDRGTLEPGKAADVLLIDPDRLAAADSPRFVRDFPAGSGRYVVDAEGYEAVIVNGEPLLRNGEPTGAAPGTVLRPGT